MIKKTDGLEFDGMEIMDKLTECRRLLDYDGMNLK